MKVLSIIGIVIGFIGVLFGSAYLTTRIDKAIEAGILLVACSGFLLAFSIVSTVVSFKKHK